MSDPSDFAQRRSRLSPAKQELLERRLRGKWEAKASPQAIPRLADRTGAPLSFAQQRLWFAHQWGPEIAAYNRPTALRLKGDLHVPSLQRSLNEIVRRHEILRTAFPDADGQPMQRVRAMEEVSLSVEDLTLLPPGDRLASAQQQMVDMACRPFTLGSGPLFRVGLYRLDAADHLFAFITHHILFDGWSEVLFVNELCALYGSFRSNERSTLPELTLQYADFAHWQRETVQTQGLNAQLSYWRATLDGALPILDLPTDRPRPPVQTYRGATQSLGLSGPLVAALEAVSRQEDVTLFMTLLAGFKVMLCRYTGQTDVTVGTLIAGRRQPETEKLIGVFVNTLALRTDLAGDPTFRELLPRIRQSCLGAYAHQDLPFEMLVAELNPARDLSRTPVFQVLFHLENLLDRAGSAGELQVTPHDVDSNVALFDLSVELVQRNGGIHCAFVYNTDLFDRSTIRRMVGHYETLLQGVVADPGQRLSDLPLLTDAERRQVLVQWNGTQAEYARDAAIHQLYEAQVERTPESVAVIFADKVMTYRELNQRANQLAHCLRRLGVGPEALVGLCVERSLEIMVGLLGVLKAGGAYVPLDPAYPKERLAYMLSDAQVAVLVTQERLVAGLPAHTAQVVCLDADWEMIGKESTENVDSGAGADNVAYVLYTSGSTGKPKGVVGLHRGAVNRFHWMWETIPFGDSEVLCQKSSLSWVDSVWEIFGPLLQGVPLVLIPGEVLIDPASLIRVLAQHRVTRIVLVPSLLCAILDACPDLQVRLPTLKVCVASGEALAASLAMRFRRAMPECRLLNLYGSSEVSADATWYDVGRDGVHLSSVPIGRPICNTQIYILDPHMQPVPIGVPGEICVGGDSLARGYHRRPELTAGRFVPDALSGRPGSRLYRTGDKARYLPDGNIEFLGRLDRQVKVRGFRIEPVEIEKVLEQHPGVRQALVVAREDLPGGWGLVAYLAVSQAARPTIADLRSYVHEQLPDHMTPAAFVYLDALPLTLNGKLDLRALPKPGEGDRAAQEAFAAPRDRVERALVHIWEEVLGVRPVGIGDDFFALGGHSLLGIRLFARIEKELGKKLPVALLFQSPTVERLAQAIRGDRASTDWPLLIPIQAGGCRPPFFCVHGLGGGVLGYAELARLLGPEQPVYGLQARGLDRRPQPDARIEDMAARYVQAVRTVQPDGPYYLGGYCLGGVVAFEMARQFRAQGEQVALLAVLEGYALRRSQAVRGLWHPRALARFLLNLPYWLRDAMRQPGARQRLLTRLRRQPGSGPERRAWEAHAERVVAENLGDGTDIPVPYRQLMAVHLQALRDYNPPPYPGRVTLFRVRALSLTRSYDPEMGWAKLAAGGVEVRMVSGAHYNMLERPHVEVLAAKLRESLDRAQERESLLQAGAPNQARP